MPQVLELAHLVEHDGVADVDVGRRRIQAELDAQRLAGGFRAASLRTQSACGRSSSQPRRLTASASRTRSVTGYGDEASVRGCVGVVIGGGGDGVGAGRRAGRTACAIRAAEDVRGRELTVFLRAIRDPRLYTLNAILPRAEPLARFSDEQP
jgi:hypothetical protein